MNERMGNKSLLIECGHYVIVQRQGYTKLHKLKENSKISLGKDIVELDNVVGRKYFETFRMMPVPNCKRTYTLEEVTEIKSITQRAISKSGADNRNITDDGSSQTLTTEEIVRLRDEVRSSSDMVEKLITNSKTFDSKTGYSQEKYLKKKEKKYFEYIQIRKPTIRLLAQMYYRQEPMKVLGMRLDDLSQILTYANIHSHGNFFLYDSGTCGLMCAAIMNAIGANTDGHLIHAHPGNECQKTAFLAMQFPAEQTERCVNVNLYSVLRRYHQNWPPDEIRKLEQRGEDAAATSENNAETLLCREKRETMNKRKFEEIADEDSEGNKTKKLRWQIDNERACAVLARKVDGLVIIAKEHPISVVDGLVDFLHADRNIIVFSLIREPLQELYIHLKKSLNFISLKLTNNLMRNYQILPERTHPEVNMNFGGYILFGIKVNVQSTVV